MHKIVKNLERSGYSFHLQFDTGEKRWVDLEPLVNKNPKYGKYRGHAWMLDEVYIMAGGLYFPTGQVSLSASTAFHMGKAPVPAEPVAPARERVWAPLSTEEITG